MRDPHLYSPRQQTLMGVADTPARQISNDGLQAYNDGDSDRARELFGKALSLDPDCSAALTNLAAICLDDRNFRSAEMYARRAAQIDPASPMALNALANALMRQRRYPDAIGHYNRLVSQWPSYAGGWHGLGLAYRHDGDFKKAIAAYDRAIELDPSQPAYRSDRAHARLSQGELLTAWESLDDTRWWFPPTRFAQSGIPRWEGQPLADKTVIVVAEQGHGDTLMFIRFLPLLVQQGAKVVAALHYTMQTLFHGWCGIEVIDMDCDDIPAADYQVTMLDVARRLKIDWPDIQATSKPYLDVEPAFPKVGPFTIGLCWAPKYYPSDSCINRSPTIKPFLPLMGDARLRVVSLMLGDPALEIWENGVEGLIDDLSDRFFDWRETAGYVKSLDMVITVDTAMAHLAGALGVKTLMVHAYESCWRWGPRGSPTTAWYDSMLLFPQERPGDWSKPFSRVMNTVRQDLEKHNAAVLDKAS